MSNDLSLRVTFDEEALLYHKARPQYPKALFDTLIEVTNLPTAANLLEIGPGTGQATEELAKHGYTITAVELGKNLADVAREILKNYPNVKIITGAFEDIELIANSFDLIYSATAFHWIKPEVRYIKPHQLLKCNGYLAIIHTNYVSDESGDAFFHASQPIYDKYTLQNNNEKFQLPHSTELKPPEIDRQLFELVLFKTFPVEITSTAKEYVDLLNTFSPNRALPADVRTKFFDAIYALINEQFDGSITRQIVMTLAIAKRLENQESL